MPAIDQLYILGAGFSANAGLPLAAGFTKKLLDCSGLRTDSLSENLVEFLRSFVDDVFGGGTEVEPDHWPHLEDLFTVIDLAANTGHNLGRLYPASVLRTCRRALIVRLMRMLRQEYQAKRVAPDAAWRVHRELFASLHLDTSAFLSMNWDTVIEEALVAEQRVHNFDYGCGAIAAHYDRASRVRLRSIPSAARAPSVLKPHGSINWMYCDACRQLFWFQSDDVLRIARRLFKDSDAATVEEFIGKRPKPAAKPARCPECRAVALGTRFATFSYRKALDFPMHAATWRAAEQLLREAKSWIFIGYSMPAADYEFKQLLKQVQLSRPQKPEIILVTGGTLEAALMTVDTYRRFFGPSSITDDDVVLTGLDSVALTKLRARGIIT